MTTQQFIRHYNAVGVMTRVCNDATMLLSFSLKTAVVYYV